MNRITYEKDKIADPFVLKLSFKEWAKAKDKKFLQLHKMVTAEEWKELVFAKVFPLKTHCYVETEDESGEIFDTIHVINITNEHSDFAIKNTSEGKPFEVSINYDFSHWYAEKYTTQEAEFCVRLKIAYNKG